MATFWGSAERGFNRGVGFGADLYQRALDNAASAREEARQARLDQIAQKNQERAQRLAAELHQRRVIESKVREAQARFEMQLTKDAQAAQEAGSKAPVPDSLRQAAQEAYGVAVPVGTTMGDLSGLGVDPEKVMEAVGRVRLRKIPSQSVSTHISNRGGGDEPTVRGGRVAALEEIDAEIARLEGQMGELNPEMWTDREDLQEQIEKYRAERRRGLSGLSEAEFQAYESRPRTTDAAETFLPGLSPMGGSNRLQQALDGAREAQAAAQTGVAPAPDPLPARAVPQGAPEPDEFDFLDDFDL